MPRQLLLISIIALSAEGVPLSAEGAAVKPLTLKEPNYQIDQPLYCKLLFEKKLLKEKRDVTVWMVIDGDHLYIDKNANGDLTEPGERLRDKPEPGNQIQLTHPGLREKIRDVTIQWRMAETYTVLNVSLSVEGQFVLGSIQGELSLSKSPEKAPVILVSDELSLFVFESPRFYLWTGNNARTILCLDASLGTKSSTGHYAYVEPESLPKDVCPMAEIEYAPKKPGDDPRKQLAEIDRSGMNYFIGSPTVPQGTPPGPVTVTVKLENWKSYEVKPAVAQTTLPRFKDLPTRSPK